MVGSVHHWDGSGPLDQFLFGGWPGERGDTSLRTLEALHRAPDRLDVATLLEAQDRQDATASQRIVQDASLSVGTGD